MDNIANITRIAWQALYLWIQIPITYPQNEIVYLGHQLLCLYLQHKAPLDLAGVIFAFIALLVTPVAIWLAIRHAEELKETTGKLEVIKNSLSTHLIGSFPDHLDRITEYVQNAKSSIDVLADCVDFGSFYNPDAHEKYLQAIIKAKKKISIKTKKKYPVRILVWGEARALSLASDTTHHLKQEREFCKSLKTRVSLNKQRNKFRNKLGEFFNAVTAETSVAYTSEAKKIKDAKVTFSDVQKFPKKRYQEKEKRDLALTALQLCLHEWTARKLITNRVKVHISKNRGTTKPELFFWIIDGEKAIFIIPRSGHKAQGFFTNDQELVHTFTDNFNQKFCSEESESWTNLL